MAPENSQNAYQMEGLSRNWALFIRNPIGKTGVILLIIFGLMAVGSFLPPQIDTMYHPMTGVDPLIANSSPPSWKHWLGTDYMGRDLFSQLLTGARIAFIVGITSAFISIVFGTIIGMLAGYGGKILDSVLMRLADMIMVMPTLLVVLLLSSLLGQLNIWAIVLLIALFRWPGVARVIRSQTLSLKERPFIDLAKISGASHFRIIFRHIAPNVLPMALLFMTFRVTSAIIIEAVLAFLGFGDPSTVSWGMMLQWVWKTGHMFQAPYWLIPPGVCISLITLSFYMIGRAMEEILDPRLRKEGKVD
ncbi:MAG: ABC transporter permease [Deltaproteobacteria bacterium]|nr:ABC transporter permease [Deltaproteobacteria bacterium]MBT6504803.1 ABC transporter permease [Deltaproteobacteria bacterium]MBT6614799.1 ABC transporter permease [Deltaproteobacteria bacterium]MBT7151701.1 ABC transporter permease [Deltaproteobacteria bacterium]MBT7710795.1 ABC transporter permease [Deltaproteobacteria bacterium]